jgi:hypothetical protein
MNSASEQSQKVVSSPLFCTFASVLTGQSRKKLPVLCTYQRIADGTIPRGFNGTVQESSPLSLNRYICLRRSEFGQRLSSAAQGKIER